MFACLATCVDWQRSETGGERVQRTTRWQLCTHWHYVFLGPHSVNPFNFSLSISLPCLMVSMCCIATYTTLMFIQHGYQLAAFINSSSTREPINEWLSHNTTFFNVFFISVDLVLYVIDLHFAPVKVSCLCWELWDTNDRSSVWYSPDAHSLLKSLYAGFKNYAG